MSWFAGASLVLRERFHGQSFGITYLSFGSNFPRLSPHRTKNFWVVCKVLISSMSQLTILLSISSVKENMKANYKLYQYVTTNDLPLS
jgi:hypothetical protein